MLEADALRLLRCPIDPARETELVLEGHHVFCSRCRVQFKTRDGMINLIAADAVLPEGCERAEKLPCRQQRRGRGA